MSNSSGIGNATNNQAGTALHSQGVSAVQFVTSLGAGFVAFAVQFLLFLVFRKQWFTVYEARTCLVPERKRVKPAPRGFFAWLEPVFSTRNPDFISKCGLDAYFFLRYLRALIKIIVLCGVVSLPILLPINATGGQTHNPAANVTGLDQLSWTNISPANAHKHTAHLVMAVWVILVVCYVCYDELRGYVRMRQAFLTSPQHRMRASATTVLVTSVPMRWMTYHAMEELYDVFPGGLKNVWLNRNYSALADKVEERDNIARKLEAAETSLIRKCKKKNGKMVKKDEKKNAQDGGKANGKGVADTSSSDLEHGTASGAPTPNETDLAVQEQQQQKKFGLGLPGVALNNVRGVYGNVERVVGGVTGEVTQGLRQVGGRVNELVDPDQMGFISTEDPDNNEEGMSAGRPDAAAEDARVGLQGVPKKDEGHNSSIPNTPDAGPYQDGENASAKVNGPGSDTPADKASKWKVWKTNPASGLLGKKKKAAAHEADEVPLSQQTPKPSQHMAAAPPPPFVKKELDYPTAFDENYVEDDVGSPVWKKYITDKDRDTIKLLTPKWSFLSFLTFLPGVGRKVDAIYWYRRELARLTAEIELDQENPEDFPLMNSVFIQFHSQVAAHMACQALNHHVPQHMAPRYLEVNPADVVWENMRIKWWERYGRTGIVTVCVVGTILLWAFPVAFVGAISNISYLTDQYPWLDFLEKIPPKVLGIVQGILPPLLLSILLALLPMYLRLMAKYQGNHTGIQVELSVQNWYFAFLFVQLFLVVTLSTAITVVLQQISKNIASTPQILASNLPKASNFFFSYLLLQGFGVSGGALLQVGYLLVNLFMRQFDNTARQKWTRKITLSNVQWGTLFPVATNLGVITIIYSVIAPLILVFAFILFALFWIVYRYNLIYVFDTKIDSAGLFFPKAINHLFTGLYVMEGCLIGLFFLVRDEKNDVYCFPHGIIMIILLAVTILYQFLLNSSFAPLFQYLPITLEDDAAAAEEEYMKRYDDSRNEATRLTILNGDNNDVSIEDRLKAQEEQEEVDNQNAEDIEMKEFERKNAQDAKESRTKAEKLKDYYRKVKEGTMADDKNISHLRNAVIRADEDQSPDQRQKDLEAATERKAKTLGEMSLFDHIADELEDLTLEQRDALVERAFQADCLRAKRPVVWIPRDDLGISEDEIRRTSKLTKYIWISNMSTGLDPKVRVTYRKSPPDYDERDLIEL